MCMCVYVFVLVYACVYVLVYVLVHGLVPVLVYVLVHGLVYMHSVSVTIGQMLDSRHPLVVPVSAPGGEG